MDYRIFNMCTGVYRHMQESALKVNSGRKSLAALMLCGIQIPHLHRMLHVAIIVATAAVSPGSVWRADSQRFSRADVHVATILATVF